MYKDQNPYLVGCLTEPSVSSRLKQGLMGLGSAQPLHLLLQPQFFALQSCQGFGIGSWSVVFLKNPRLKRSVTVIEGSDPGIQAHTEASFAVMQPGRLALSRAAGTCYFNPP